jgi:hypothetical protein
MEEAPHAPPVGAGAAPPPNPPPRPANGSHRFPNTLGQVGGQYGPSIAPFARARCPFVPLLRPYSPGGAACGSHAGQFSCFGPRSCFIAFVLDIPNGVCPLDRAVGRAYIRETVPCAYPQATIKQPPPGASSQVQLCTRAEGNEARRPLSNKQHTARHVNRGGGRQATRAKATHTLPAAKPKQEMDKKATGGDAVINTYQQAILRGGG